MNLLLVLYIDSRRELSCVPYTCIFQVISFKKKEHTLVFLFGNEIIGDFGRVTFHTLGSLSCYISLCQKNIRLFRNIMRKRPFYVCVYVYMCINNGCNI